MKVNLQKMLVILEEKIGDDFILLEMEVNGKQALATVELVSNGRRYVYDIYEHEMDF